MPAKLDLLPRKTFQIKLETGEVIEGIFGTWALFRFCKIKKIGLDGLTSVLDGFELDDIVQFVLCAVEQSCREAKKPFNYTDADLCKWIDQIEGGMGVPLINIFKHFTADESGDEKKSEQLEESQIHGQTSSELQPAQV